jgi:tetratricopeptide (TPR) repeat protein
MTTSNISQPPTHLRQLLAAGDGHRNDGDLESAIDAYEQVADCYREAGRLNKALVVYRHVWGIVRLHQLDHHQVRIARHLGDVAVELGDPAEALNAYDAAARRLRDEGRNRDALDLYRLMRELEPSNPLVSTRLAECYAELGELDAAIPLFAHAASRFRDYGKTDQALMVLERLLDFRMVPRFARMAAEILLARRSERDALQALRLLQPCYAADRRDLAVLELLARSFDAVGQRDKATTVRGEAARIAVERSHSSGERPADEIEGEITDLLERGGELADAPLDEDTLWRAEELLFDGQFDEARAVVEQMLRRMPNHSLLCELYDRVERLSQGHEIVPATCPLPPSSRRPAQLEDATPRMAVITSMRPKENLGMAPSTARAWPPERGSEVRQRSDSNVA